MESMHLLSKIKFHCLHFYVMLMIMEKGLFALPYMLRESTIIFKLNKCYKSVDTSPDPTKEIVTHKIFNEQNIDLN